MSIVKYNLEVCTRNLYLATSEISRAYALLISDISKGTKYGFEYIFFREVNTRMDELILAGHGDLDNTIIKEDILLSESSRETDAHFMNSSLSATNPDSYGLVNNGIVQMKSTHESISEIFDVQDISENILSTAYIQDTSFIADDKLSIGQKLDKIIESVNKNYSTAKITNHMRSFGNSKESESYLLDTRPTASRFHNSISQLDNSIKSTDRRISVNSTYMNNMPVVNTYGSKSWINHTNVYGKKNQVKAKETDKMIYGSNKTVNGTIDYTTKMFDGHTGIKAHELKTKLFTKTHSREVRYTLFTKSANRYGKFARFNDVLLFDRSQMRQIKFSETIGFDRTGKLNVLIDKNVIEFERVGKLNTFIVNDNIFAGRIPKDMLFNQIHYLLDTSNRQGNIYYNTIYSDVGNSVLFLPDANEVFNYGTIPTRNGRLDEDMLLMDKESNTFILDTFMLRAEQPEKMSVLRLFNIFDADVIKKVIFSVKSLRESAMFSSMQIIQASRQGHESIIIIDIKELSHNKNSAIISDTIINMISHDVDSVILVGVNSADNVQTESDFMVAKFTADSKAYIETAVNLMAVGWGKCEHDTNIDIELIDSDNAYINQSIMEELMELATGMNKDRLGEYVKSYKLMEKNKDKLQAIEHGFLVRMNRIPEQKPIEVVKLQSAEWDTEWEKLCNIRIESKDKYDKIKVPNDDYDYSQLISQVYNTTTGVPFKPKSPINVAEVEVNLPIAHYNKYSNLTREEIPVDLYIYKDTMLLIWIFWCKNRSLSENILGTLKEFYETENLEMTMFQEFAKIAQMDAAKAISYILDKCNDWIQNTISYYDPERMNQYERVMKQVRWFGEKVTNELSKYILVREYNSTVYDLTKVLTDSRFNTDSIKLNQSNHLVSTNTVGRIYITNHTQPVDGELIIETILKNTGKLTIQIEDETKITVIEPGIYMNNNPSNSAFIKPAIKIELPAGSYNVKILLEGGIDNCEIVTIEATNNTFKSASMRFEAKPGTGTQAIDKILSMMYDYYEIHHIDKTKGERSLWVSE